MVNVLRWSPFAGALILFSALSGLPAVADQTVVRQYDPDGLAMGRDLFRQHCAVCHGWNAEGTVEDWRKRDAAGKLPPPPLNGTAHAWHHSASVLRRIIRDGTLELGGGMQPWRDKLTDQEMLSIIIWMTSLWPDSVYAMWLERGGMQ